MRLNTYNRLSYKKTYVLLNEMTYETKDDLHVEIYLPKAISFQIAEHAAFKFLSNNSV